MECKEFEKRIPDFIGRRLDYVGLKNFMSHMDSCSQCKEELTIQFLMEEGLVRLEEGSAFDLKYELRVRMEEAIKKIGRHDRYVRVGTVFEYIIMLGIVGVIVMITCS